ncbi:MAG: transposase [Sandaracinaceae bacterium]
MAKRTYRAIAIEKTAQGDVEAAVGAERGIIAVDLAKRKMVASFADTKGCVGRIAKFERPRQTREFVEHVKKLAMGRPVEVVMESTGTYGDPIRYQLACLDIPMFDVGTKRVHDAAEVFDGVPSLHDAKSCVVMTQLHVQGATRAAQRVTDAQRSMRALVNRREIYALPYEQALGRIEGVLARHWPEGLEVLQLWRRHSTLRLLEKFPAPAQIVKHRKDSRRRATSMANASDELASLRSLARAHATLSGS